MGFKPRINCPAGLIHTLDCTVVQRSRHPCLPGLADFVVFQNLHVFELLVRQLVKFHGLKLVLDQLVDRLQAYAAPYEFVSLLQLWNVALPVSETLFKRHREVVPRLDARVLTSSDEILGSSCHLCLLRSPALVLTLFNLELGQTKFVLGWLMIKRSLDRTRLRFSVINRLADDHLLLFFPSLILNRCLYDFNQVSGLNKRLSGKSLLVNHHGPFNHSLSGNLTKVSS